jgi:tetratricopeptide (TPR) repeat protein
MSKDSERDQEDYFFHDLFTPLTTKKAIIFIAVVGFVVYFYMLFNGFVWDDKTYILFNPDVLSFNLSNLIKNNIFNAGGQYRPIPGIYFASLFALFKTNTFFYHLLQFVIHIVNASLLFLLFKRFFSKQLSLVLSLIFLIHPMQVESVSYIASSANPLFALFGLLVLSASFSSKISGRMYAIISLLLLLSLLTKEAGILFVFVLLLFVFLFKRNKFLMFFISTSISLVCYSVIRFLIGGVFFSTLPLIPIAQLSFEERLINIPAIFFYYIKTFFFPLQLAVDQQWVVRTITFQSFYLPLFIDLLSLFFIILLGLVIYKKKIDFFKIYLFFFGWFLVGMALYSQIFPLDGIVADRWFYFPMVGILGILGVCVQLTHFSHKEVKTVSYSIITVVLVILSIRTIQRNTNWYDAITLYSKDIQVSDNFDIENNLGIEYASIRDYKNAIKHSTKSVTLFPYEANIYNLANTYEQMGDIQNAKKYYAKALTYPNYLPINHEHIQYTYIRLAYMMYLTNDFKNAVRISQQGLQEYPDSPYLWIELASCMYKLGDQTEALQSAAKAKSLLPTDQMDALYLQMQNRQSIVLRV